MGKIRDCEDYIIRMGIGEYDRGLSMILKKRGRIKRYQGEDVYLGEIYIRIFNKGEYRLISRIYNDKEEETLYVISEFLSKGRQK